MIVSEHVCWWHKVSLRRGGCPANTPPLPTLYDRLASPLCFLGPTRFLSGGRAGIVLSCYAKGTAAGLHPVFENFQEISPSLPASAALSGFQGKALEAKTARNEEALPLVGLHEAMVPRTLFFPCSFWCRGGLRGTNATLATDHDVIVISFMFVFSPVGGE